MSIDELIIFAEQGIAKAQNDLGISYMTGNGVDLDVSKAIEWFSKAAEQNEPSALANLGRCYMEGTGVEKSTADAIYLLASASMMGIEGAEQYLINAIDINELIELSEQANAKAQYFLGMCYVYGCKVEQSIEKACDWVGKAAEQSDPLALLFLGKCLVNGIGLERNLFQAEYTLKKALKQAEKHVGKLGIVNVKREMDCVRDSIVNTCPFILVKVLTTCKDDGIAEDKYVSDFLDGKLFMKTLDQFGDMMKRDSSSKNSFRGDILEGFSESFGSGYNPYIYKKDKGDNIERYGMLGMIDILKLREKVFCLTAIEYVESQQCFIKPDSQMKEFGDYAVIITDAEEFMRRVHIAFNRLCEKYDADFWMAYDRVKYNIDLSQQFKYIEFRKSEPYSWQKEFRIVIDFSEGKFSTEMLSDVTDFAKLTFQGTIELDNNPLSLKDWIYLEIGDIRDICVCKTIDELISVSKIELTFEKKPVRIAPYIPHRNPRPTFCKGVAAIRSDDANYRLVITRDGFFSTVI